jgi:Ca-activated chloride channel family protein
LLNVGISVSTLGLGLGYIEDLMSRLASAASGNHMFVEQEDDLVAVFDNEFSDLMSVVAGDLRIHARVGEGVRPVRVLGTEADITGRDIYIPLAQLYADQERYFVLELEVSGGQANTGRPLAEVDVEYQNMMTETTENLSRRVDVRFTDEIADVESGRDHETTAYCAVQIANERNMKATELRDAGQINEAKKLLIQNVDELSRTAESCRTNNVAVVLPDLEMNINFNRTQVELVEQKDWNRNRKAMRATQSIIKSQQRDSSSYGLDSLYGKGSRSKGK